jgi:hypothetical protein
MMWDLRVTSLELMYLSHLLHALMGGRLPAVSAASACARCMNGASLSPLLRVRTRQASHHATARTLCQVRRARRVPLLPVCTP